MSNEKKSTRFRAGIARGLDPKRGRVDHENAKIYGLAVITEGEAKGHGVNIDAEEVEKVVKLGNAAPKGLKARFGHPNMSATALGTVMGHEDNFYLDHDAEGRAVARADMNFMEAARRSPNFQKDPVAYLLELAETAPEAFGTSIVFKEGKTYVRDDKGNRDYDWYDRGRYGERFRKDKYNDGRLLFIEIDQLKADDFVDTPAANSSGLFSAGNVPLAAAVTEFLDENEELFAMLKAGDAEAIVTGFMSKYDAYKAGRGGNPVAGNNAGGEACNPQAGKAAPIKGAPTKLSKPEKTNKEPQRREATPMEITTENVKQFNTAFGAAKGMEYLSAGLSFEAAEAKFAEAKQEELSKENTDLKTQLAEATTAHETALAAKDAELKTATDELAALKAGGAAPVEAGELPAETDGEADPNAQLSENAIAHAWHEAEPKKYPTLFAALKAVRVKYPEKDQSKEDED